MLPIVVVLVSFFLAYIEGNNHSTHSSLILPKHIIISEYLSFFRDALLNVHYSPFKEAIDGSQWPSSQFALTMLGQRRLDNYVSSVMTVISEGIPGNIIETGVWRGGASMLAAKTVHLMGEASSRKVYFADSFKGIPPPPKDGKFSSQDSEAYKQNILNENSVGKVKEKAVSFGLNLEDLVFVEGYFNESLPALVAREPNVKFAVVRLDGDTYFSTMDAISILYPRLEKGGFLIVDDYIGWIGCKNAIDDYRRQNNIKEPLTLVPHMSGEMVLGVYWRKGVDDSNSPYCSGATGGIRTLRSYNPSKLVDAPMADCGKAHLIMPTCDAMVNTPVKMCTV